MFVEKIYNLTFIPLVEEFIQYFAYNCFEAKTARYCKLHNTSSAKNGWRWKLYQADIRGNPILVWRTHKRQFMWQFWNTWETLQAEIQDDDVQEFQGPLLVTWEVTYWSNTELWQPEWGNASGYYWDVRGFPTLLGRSAFFGTSKNYTCLLFR